MNVGGRLLPSRGFRLAYVTAATNAPVRPTLDTKRPLIEELA